MTKRFLISALSLAFTVSVANADEPTKKVKHILTYEEPKPIVRVEPKYPIDAARQSREGWTRLSFVVNEKGHVNDVLLLESSGSADLDRESIRAVKKWKYSPALENGQPIEQCLNSVRMNFKMKGSTTVGVSKKFKRYYKKALAYMESKNYSDMMLTLDKIKGMKSRHLSENNYYHLFLADYYKEMNQPEKELEHLNNVSTHAGLSDKLSFSVLYRRYNQQITTNRLSSAIHTYKKLMKSENAQQYKDQLEQSLQDITKFIESPQDIIVSGDMGTEDFWRHTLVRNSFSLANIEGTLHKLDVRCANKRHIYSVEDNNTWNIPSTWKNCSIFLYGDDKTTFKVVEHS